MGQENEIEIANDVGNKPSRASRMFKRVSVAFSSAFKPTPPPLDTKPKIDSSGRKIQGNSSGEQVKINAAGDIIQNNSSGQNTTQQNSPLPYEATTPLIQASQGEQEKQELLKEHEKTNALAYEQPAYLGEMITNDYRNTVPSNEAKQHEMEEIKKTRNKILLTRWKYFAIGLILLGIILLTLFSPPVLVLLPFVISLSFPVEVAIVISGLASLIAGVGIFFKRVLGKSWFPTIAMMVFTLSLAFLIPAFVPALKGLLLFATLANYAMEYLAGAIISFGAYAANALSKRWILNAADVKKADIKTTENNIASVGIESPTSSYSQVQAQTKNVNNAQEWVQVYYKYYESGKDYPGVSSDDIKEVSEGNEIIHPIENKWYYYKDEMLLDFLKVRAAPLNMRAPFELLEVKDQGSSKKNSNVYILELATKDQSNSKLQIKKTYEFIDSHKILLSSMWRCNLPDGGCRDSMHEYILYSPTDLNPKNKPTTKPTAQSETPSTPTLDSLTSGEQEHTAGAPVPQETTSSSKDSVKNPELSYVARNMLLAPSPSTASTTVETNPIADIETQVTANPTKSLPQIPTPTLMPTN
jgi:hypothetical protein